MCVAEKEMRNPGEPWTDIRAGVALGRSEAPNVVLSDSKERLTLWLSANRFFWIFLPHRFNPSQVSFFR